jgi:hypothetical protein
MPVAGHPPHTAALVLSYDSESLARNRLSLHKILDPLPSPDIIQLRVEANLRDRLHWCGLQGLGGSV